MGWFGKRGKNSAQQEATFAAAIAPPNVTNTSNTADEDDDDDVGGGGGGIFRFQAPRGTKRRKNRQHQHQQQHHQQVAINDDDDDDDDAVVAGEGADAMDDIIQVMATSSTHAAASASAQSPGTSQKGVAAVDKLLSVDTSQSSPSSSSAAATSTEANAAAPDGTEEDADAGAGAVGTGFSPSSSSSTSSLSPTTSGFQSTTSTEQAWQAASASASSLQALQQQQHVVDVTCRSMNRHKAAAASNPSSSSSRKPFWRRQSSSRGEGGASVTSSQPSSEDNHSSSVETSSLSTTPTTITTSTTAPTKNKKNHRFVQVQPRIQQDNKKKKGKNNGNITNLKKKQRQGQQQRQQQLDPTEEQTETEASDAVAEHFQELSSSSSLSAAAAMAMTRDLAMAVQTHKCSSACQKHHHKKHLTGFIDNSTSGVGATNYHALHRLSYQQHQYDQQQARVIDKAGDRYEWAYQAWHEKGLLAWRPATAADQSKSTSPPRRTAAASYVPPPIVMPLVYSPSDDMETSSLALSPASVTSDSSQSVGTALAAVKAPPKEIKKQPISFNLEEAVAEEEPVSKSDSNAPPPPGDEEEALEVSRDESSTCLLDMPLTPERVADLDNNNKNQHNPETMTNLFSLRCSPIQLDQSMMGNVNKEDHAAAVLDEAQNQAAAALGANKKGLNHDNSSCTASTVGALEKQMMGKDDSTKKKLFDSTTTSASNQDQEEENTTEEKKVTERETSDVHAMALDDLLKDNDKDHQHLKRWIGMARDLQVATPSTVAATVETDVEPYENSSATKQQPANNPWNVSLKSRPGGMASPPTKKRQGQQHRIHSWKYQKACMEGGSVTSQTREFPQDDPNLSAYHVWHKKGLLPWSPVVSKSIAHENKQQSLATNVTMEESEDCAVTLEPSILTNASTLTGDDMDESSSTWRSKLSPDRPKSQGSSGDVARLTSVFRQKEEVVAAAVSSVHSFTIISPSASDASSSTAVSRARMKKAACAARARHVCTLTHSRSVSSLKSRSATQLCWFGTACGDENIIPMPEVTIDSTPCADADTSMLSESKSPPRAAVYSDKNAAAVLEEQNHHALNSSAELSSVGSPCPYQSYVSAYKTYAKDRSSSANRQMQMEAEQRLVDRRGFMSPANMPSNKNKKKAKKSKQSTTTTLAVQQKMEQWEKLKEERRDRMKRLVRGEGAGQNQQEQQQR